MTKNRKRVIIACCFTLLLCLFLTLLANFSVGFAEWYSVNVYPIFVGSIGRVASIVPFSISEIFIYCTILYLISMLAVLVFGLISKKTNNSNVLETFFVRLLLVFTIILLSCNLFAGINYYRIPFSYYSKLIIEEPNTQELYELCKELTEELNQLSEERENIKLSGGISIKDMSLRSKEAMESLGEEFDVLSGFYPNLKPLLSSKIMSYAGFSGVYYPFPIEANFNKDVTDFTLPATMCHELSHLKGFMREDEANFIAFLACRNSDDVSLQYSGYMLALNYSMDKLYEANEDMYHSVYNAYSQTIKDDLHEEYIYWESHKNILAEVSKEVYDTYLKFNNQSDGIESYGRMVDLLIADYNKSMKV